MADTCPTCGYDLAGLAAGESLRCPECGRRVGDDAALSREQLKRQFRNACILTGCAPLMALPGCLLAGVGQIILSWLLTSLGAYRALGLDEMLRNRPSAPGMRLAGAILIGLAWTLIADIVIVPLAMFVGWAAGAR